MNYLKEIESRIIDNEIYLKIKDYSKEINKVKTYYEIGKLLYEAGSKYGENIIKNYSKKLTVQFGSNYSYRNLISIRKYYCIFKNEKVNAMRSLLTWTHYRELIRIIDLDEIIYYINISLQFNLSSRKLIERIKNTEYERLDENTKLKLRNKEETRLGDLIKNPIIIKNNNNYEIISEKVLQKLILEDIPSFLKELGNNFSFIENEYKIKIGSTYNYIDLLLYNIEFNCYVIIELKVTQLKKEHIGQIQVYMNYIDDNLKKANQEKTIGIIIVKKNNNYIIEYCSDKRIIAKEYNLI